MADPLFLPLAQSFFGMLGQSEGAAALVAAIEQGVAELLVVGQEQGAVRADLPLPALSAITMGVLMAVDRLAIHEMGNQELGKSEVRAWTAMVMDLLKRLLRPERRGEL